MTSISPHEVPDWPEITAIIEPSGAGAVVIDGAIHPITETSPQAARSFVTRFVAAEVAQKHGRPVRVRTSDELGHWDLLVFPDGSLRDIGAESASAGTNAPAPGAKPVDQALVWGGPLAVAAAQAQGAVPSPPAVPAPTPLPLVEIDDATRAITVISPNTTGPGPAIDDMTTPHPLSLQLAAEQSVMSTGPAPMQPAPMPPAPMQPAPMPPAPMQPAPMPPAPMQPAPMPPAPMQPAPMQPAPSTLPSTPLDPVAPVAPMAQPPGLVSAPQVPPMAQPYLESVPNAPQYQSAPGAISTEPLVFRPMTPDQAPSFLNTSMVEPPATKGVRGILTKAGIKTAPSEGERAERIDRAAVSHHWPGSRTIAIVNGKGGSNKTPTTALLAAAFARNGGSGVLAWDNNETRGTLGWRTEQGPHVAHVQDLLPMIPNLLAANAHLSSIDSFVHHQSNDRYAVLRSNPEVLARVSRLSAADFDAIHGLTQRYFRLVFIDSGNDESSENWQRMIDRSDQIVVATTNRAEHAEAGRLLLDALARRDERSARLAAGAVVIVSKADKEESDAEEIADGFANFARAAVTVPYDRAMRAPLLTWESLQSATERAWLGAAAEVARGL